jgi:hypothetical protein
MITNTDKSDDYAVAPRMDTDSDTLLGPLDLECSKRGKASMSRLRKRTKHIPKSRDAVDPRASQTITTTIMNIFLDYVRRYSLHAILGAPRAYTPWLDYARHILYTAYFNDTNGEALLH